MQNTEQDVATSNPNPETQIPARTKQEGDKGQSKPIIRPGYLRKADAAKYLGISVRTLSQWMQQHFVAHIKVSHSVCLFKLADLDAAMGRFRLKAVGE